MRVAGRFTGRQITAMVVAGCVAVVLAPTLAVASGVSLVTLTDPTHATYRAHVSSAGRLLTSTNGSVGVVGTVGVAGTVANRELLPALPWSVWGTATNNGVDRVQFVAAPTTRAIGLSSLVVSATGTGPIFARVRAVTSTTGSCDGPVTVLNETMKFTVPSGGTVAIPFATPLTIRPPAGQKICMFASVDPTSSNDAAITVSASGLLQ